jgi:flavin-dependent dehydrogenase
MINPLTGEGIFYGMYAALRLGELLARPLTEHAGVPRALATFQDEFLAAFARHFRGTLLLRRILEIPALQPRLARALQRRGSLHFGYVEYVMGLMPPRRPTPLHRLALASLLPGLVGEV